MKNSLGFSESKIWGSCSCSSSYGGSCGGVTKGGGGEEKIPNKKEPILPGKLNMGGYKLSNCEIFDYLVDVVEGTNLMGKPYSEDPNNVYVCTTFVEEVIDILNIDKEEYLPGGQLVVNNIAQIDDLKESNGTNPSAGTYVFYYDYGDGTGHTGFVMFDEEGNTQILHNGSNGSGIPGTECVNLRTRDSRDFETWFDNPNGELYYKRLEVDIWEE